MDEKNVGIISDTHGLLRAEACAALSGSDLIIHAGDVGKPEVLEGLRAIAPVVAVRGNDAARAYGPARCATTRWSRSQDCPCTCSMISRSSTSTPPRRTSRP